MRRKKKKIETPSIHIIILVIIFNFLLGQISK